jgi:hypothetical protein
MLKRSQPKFKLKHFHLTHQLILRKTKSRSYSRCLGFANAKALVKIDTYRLSKLYKISVFNRLFNDKIALPINTPETSSNTQIINTTQY